MQLRLLSRWFVLKRLAIPLLLLTSFTVIFQSLGVVLSEPLSIWNWLHQFIYIDPVDDPSNLLVSFDAESLCDGRRLGNQLFSISALLYAARLTGRKAVLPDKTTWKCMYDFDSFFVPATGSSRGDVSVIKYSGRFNATTQSTVICPCFRFTESLPMAYDERVAELSGMTNDVSNRTLLLFGYFQSWRYVDPIADSVRRALTFAPEIREAAAAYLADALPPFPYSTSSSVDGRLVRVGIHARRGDMVSLSKHVEMGYTPPGAEFYRRAIEYFVERYTRLQFIVCSDEFDWSQQNIRGPENTTSLPDGETLNLTYVLLTVSYRRTLLMGGGGTGEKTPAICRLLLLASESSDCMTLYKLVYLLTY